MLGSGRALRGQMGLEGGVIPPFQRQQAQQSTRENRTPARWLDWQMSHVRAEGQVGSEQGEVGGVGVQGPRMAPSGGLRPGRPQL